MQNNSPLILDLQNGFLLSVDSLDYLVCGLQPFHIQTESGLQLPRP